MSDNLSRRRCKRHNHTSAGIEVSLCSSPAGGRTRVAVRDARTGAGEKSTRRTPTGAQALKQVWAVLLRAFPDIHVAVDDVIAEGDKVVCRNTVTGTHRGEYMGVPPTGRSITYKEIFIVRFAGGRIAEGWGVVDVASQMRQLGMIQA